MKIISTENFILKYKHVNFLKQAKSEPSKRVHERLWAIHHLCNGKNRHEAAAIVGRSDEWLRSWILKYHNGGYSKLTGKKPPGKNGYLTKEQEEELVTVIIQAQDDRDGGRMTGVEITDLIKEKYNITYKGTSVYDLLERLGLSWVSSRSKHPKSDEKKQKTFKQTFKARVAKIKLQKKSE